MVSDSNNNVSDSSNFNEDLPDNEARKHANFFIPLPPPDGQRNTDCELNCDEIESECMATDSIGNRVDENAKTEVQNENISETRRQLNGHLNHLSNDDNLNDSKSGGLRATGNFFKAFIAARVKAKSCPPTPSGVAIISNETTQIRPSSGGCVES